MAIYAICGNGGPYRRGEFAAGAVPRAVTGHTALRKSGQVGPFVPVWVVTGYTGHRPAFPKAPAVAEQAVLIAVDVDPVGIRPRAVNDKIA